MPSDDASAAREARLVCAILAAQVTALRELIDSPAIFERLMHCTALTAELSSQLAPGGDPATTATRLDGALDDLAFHHAQQQDLARQTAELVARALQILAEPGPANQRTLSPSALSALYVSDEQRRLHDNVLADHAARLASQPPQTE